MDMRFNVHAEAADVLAEEPDVVVIATGGFGSTPGDPREGTGDAQRPGSEFAAAGEQLMIVIDHNETEVALDGNHPLAGLDLTFALRLDAILDV